MKSGIYTMAEMGFIKPEILWHLLWLVPLFAGLFFLIHRRRLRLLRNLLGLRAGDAGAMSLSRGRRMIRSVFLFISVLLLVLAAARPYWGLRILPFSGRGRDVMIVLDVSRSMLADDVKPDRLTHAKWLLRKLIEAGPGDRYGIVAFAGEAFLECPLTVDRTSLFQSLDELSTGSIPVGGTNLEKGLETALTAFAAAEGGHRAVILVTDGDELSGESARLLDEFRDRKLPLYVVGIGDPSGSGLIKVPTEDGNSRVILRDRSGELVVSRLNEKELRNLALGSSGGIYLRSTVTDSGLNTLKNKVSELVPAEYESGRNTRPLERFHLPLAGAVFLLMLRLFLSEYRVPGGGIKLASLFLLLGFCLSASAESGGEGIDEKLSSASGIADEEPGLLLDSPDIDPVKLYNLALEAQEANDSAKAQKLYEAAINLAAHRPELRANAFRNLGVSAHLAAREKLASEPQDALKQLAIAENWYREAFRNGRDTDPIARNQQILLRDREKAEQIIEQQEQMRRKQQQAREQTEEARRNQQQANQEESQSRKEQSQQAAEKETEAAEQAVDELRQTADEQGREDISEQASKAGEELSQARQKQRDGKSEEAEKHLENALNHLGGKPEDEPQDGEQNSETAPEDDREEADTVERPDQLPPPGDGSSPPSSGEEKEIDAEQAEALLELMASDEKDLRDALRERMRERARLKPVEKDW